MEPYKEKKRERRIRDRERMIQHGKDVFYMMWGSYVFSLNTYQRHKQLDYEAEMYGRKFHDNLKMCSCPICCNPRRSLWSKAELRLTMQERKALEAEKYCETSED